MADDIIKLVGAVRRQVSQRDHEGSPARVVVATRRYDTTPDDLWDAVTNPVRIPRWFLPISGDLKLGGRYQLQGNAGGTVTSCDPPRRFSITWEHGGNTSWVDVSLAADSADGTTLQLEHVAHVPQDLWDQFGPGAVGVGWDLTLFGLGKHVGSGAAVDPGAGMAWLASPDGHVFVRGTSEDWGRAAIDSGDPEAVARASAERTRAAYTILPPPPS